MALISINPGKLDVEIELYQPVSTYDPNTNAEVVTYSLYASVRAERMFRTSAERLENSQQVGVEVQSFRFRWMGIPINQRWKIKYEGNDYFVRAVEQQGRRNFIIITAEYRDNN